MKKFLFLFLLVAVNQLTFCKNWTTYSVGDYTYTTDNRGSTYTSYSIGDYDYVSGPRGYNGSGYSIGDYYYYNDTAKNTSNDYGFNNPLSSENYF